MTTFDDLLREDYLTPRTRRPAPRHRRAGRPTTGLRTRAATVLAAARQSLHEAIHGTDTPAGGLATLVCAQCGGRTA